MQRSTKEVVAEVLQAVDIVDVLQGSMELQSAGGGRYKGLCPFHSEKTPSFFVNQQWQTFKCFGCDKHGDAITFLRDHEGLSFGEALQKLADRGGVRLPEFSSSSDDGKRAGILEFLKAAQGFYRQTLRDPMKGQVGRTYLQSRRFSSEMVERFGLGVATNEWHDIAQLGRKLKVSQRVMEASGLVKEGRGGNAYDLFRNRLIFPIHDVTGRVVAFGGRELGDGEIKYINSPESIVYKKSRILYGLFQGRDALRQTKKALLVEGYFDVIRCFEAGLETAVAPCGTALTPEQAKLLKRYVDEVTILFDGDGAGIRAAIKAVGICVAAGLGATVLVLPDGADPDDYIRDHGADAFRALLETADDFVRFYVRMNADRKGSIEGRTAMAHELFEIILDIGDELRRDEYLRVVAKELGVDAWACRREFEAFRRGRAHRESMPTEDSDAAPVRRVDEHAQQLVAIVLQQEGLRAEFSRGSGRP